VGEKSVSETKANVKVIATSIAFLAMAVCSFGQGLLHFSNNSSTLISATGDPMPVSDQFYFALFLAPSTTVNSAGQSASLTDPAFQIVSAYNTNSTIVAGRLNNRNSLSVGASQGFSIGSSVDFIVRGWSANAGTTWAEALAYWNGGSPSQPMFIGSSLVGNDFLLAGGTVPAVAVFGNNISQVLGFDMPLVPEPSALALAVLGGTALWSSVRRRKREPT